MLSKIAEVDNFGLFCRFKWDRSTTEFKKNNIIYGWNYSGKTTLSRIFSNFEFSQKHGDYPSCNSVILDDGGNTYDCTAFGFPHPIRVFNIDFIEKNLKWGDTIEPIFMIGEENIKLQEELSSLRSKIEEKTKEIKVVSEEAVSTATLLNSRVSDKAKELKNTLSVPDYTKRNLDTVIKKVGDKILIIPDEGLKRLIDTYRSSDKKLELNQIDFHTPNIDHLLVQAKDLLKTKVVTKTIEKLKANPALGLWVQQGKDIHIGKTNCEFCGNILPKDLLDRLNDHFSDEFEQHIKSIKVLISEFENKKIRFQLHDEAKFYPDFMEDIIRFGDEINRLISNFHSNLDTLIEALKNKEKHPFDEVSFPTLTDTSAIKKTIDLINSIIRKHNEKTINFEKKQLQAFDKLEIHYASELIKGSKYFETEDFIKKLRDTESEKQKELETLNGKFLEVEKQLSETVKGAEKVNEYLQSYFGRNDIELKAASNDTFQLFRNSKVARNLSEGEKTAISFAYFITKLEEKGANLENTILYIDDPISSLDSNHLFSTYSFIKNKLEGSHQLFISTHNFEFLNLLKDWLTRPKNWKKSTSFYLIERCAQDDRFISCIKDMPHEIIFFKSEYHYLFSILHEFNSNPKADFKKLYTIPNLARRFLESYLGFKIPKRAGLHGKLPDFIQDRIKVDKVLKFIDQFSHNNALPRSLMFPDFGECKECIAIIMDRIRQYDPEHYGYLVAEVEN